MNTIQQQALKILEQWNAATSHRKAKYANHRREIWCGDFIQVTTMGKTKTYASTELLVHKRLKLEARIKSGSTTVVKIVGWGARLVGPKTATVWNVFGTQKEAAAHLDVVRDGDSISIDLLN